MKQLKKAIVVLMAAALLAGCSKSAPEQTAGTAQTAKQEASTDTKTAESTQAPAKTAESTQAPAKTAESTQAPAKSAESTQAPAKAAETAQAPAKAAETAQAPAATAKTTPAPAKTAETTPAPAKTAETTPAPAKTAETTPAPAKTAETTPAPAKTAEATPAPAKTADTADKAAAADTAADEIKNTQTTAFAVKTDEAEDNFEYGIGAFLMQDGTTITVYGSELLRPEQDEDDVLRFRLLDADGEDYGTDDDDFEILAGSYRDSGLAVIDEDHIGQAFDALLAFDTMGTADEDDVVPFACDGRQGLYLVLRGFSGERSDLAILQDVDCDNFLLIRVHEIPASVKAEDVVSTVLLIL